MDERTLIDRIAKPLFIRYRDSGGRESIINGVLFRLRESVAGINVRVYLDVRPDDGPRRIKTLVQARCIEVVDLETGEVHADVPGFLESLLEEAGGAMPLEWEVSSGGRQQRTPNVDIHFGEDGYAVDWCFGVKAAFKPALDILMTPRRVQRGARTFTEKVETRGVPPAYSFKVGDMLHAPHEGLDETWGSFLGRAVWTVQVIAAVDDQRRESEITPGAVTLRVTDHATGHNSIFETTQAELARFLREGLTG